MEKGFKQQLYVSTVCFPNYLRYFWRIWIQELKLHHHKPQPQQPVCCSCYMTTPGPTQLLGCCLVFLRDDTWDDHIGLTTRQGPCKILREHLFRGSPGGVPVSFIDAKVSCIKHLKGLSPHLAFSGSYDVIFKSSKLWHAPQLSGFKRAMVQPSVTTALASKHLTGSQTFHRLRPKWPTWKHASMYAVQYDIDIKQRNTN